jgi:hypothetical protein
MKRLIIILTSVTLLALAAPAQAAPNPPFVGANQRGCDAVLKALAGGGAASFGRSQQGLSNFTAVGQAFGCE